MRLGGLDQRHWIFSVTAVTPMKQLSWLLCAGLVFLAACRRKRETAPVDPEAPAPPAVGQVVAPAATLAPAQSPAAQQSPGVQESIPVQHFSVLSQALLTFRRDKKRAPRDWQELTTSGYLKQMPNPPPGKRYMFNPTSLDVRMVNQ